MTPKMYNNFKQNGESMMKRIVSFLIFALCFSTGYAGYAGYSDGFITAGEYEYGVDWLSGLLVVNGGGADRIEVLNSALLEVRSTSIPINENWYVGGILDIAIKNNSHLDYYGGQTQELTVRGNATANLYGGRIDYITNAQFVTIPHVNIYCQPGWLWILDGTQKKVGITGLWEDNSTFNIHFTSNGEYFGADPVWENINVIIPEPASMLLLGLGGLLIRRKK
jgi:hypothetical protein